ncbi:MAG: hypothetical protein LBK23_02235, partial [Oscillospiraceae bacterium]|nr:hypothetical protein [Oscillospiraceae bacterium]
MSEYSSEKTYQFRIKAGDSASASLPVPVVPAAIVIEAVDFGEKIYGATITPVYVKVRNVSQSAIDVTLALIAGGDNFTLSPSSSFSVAANTTDSTTISITPGSGLSAKPYTAKIQAAYTEDDSEKTAEAAVTLTVIKADWVMPSQNSGTIPDADANSFTVNVTNAPVGATLKWRIGEGQAVDDTVPVPEGGAASHTFSGLTAQTTYPVYVTANGDDDHNESPEILLTTAHTAMAAPDAAAVVKIDYINETLLFNTGYSPANYTVTIGGKSITHMGSVSEFADTGNFTVSVVRNQSGNYPASAPSSTPAITGRAPAPEVIARYASTDKSADGGIEKVGGGAFQYRLVGSGAGGWQNVNNQINTLSPGLYDARLAPAAGVFASKLRENIDIQWRALAVGFTAAQTGGADGRTATTGILITFDRDVTGLSASSVTVSGAASMGTVTNYGDADAKTWLVNVTATQNDKDAIVTISGWSSSGQTYDVQNKTQTVKVFAPVPAETPKAAIDYGLEVLTGLVAGTYKFHVAGVGDGSFTLNGGDTTFPISESWMTDTTNGFSLVLAGGTNTVDSAAQTITIPKRPAAPTVGVTPSTGSDGSITVSANGFEYHKSDVTEWTPQSGGTVSGLVPDVYFVRLPATSTKFSSNAARVTVHVSGTHDFGDVFVGYDAVDGKTFTVDSSGTVTGAVLNGTNSSSYTLTPPNNVADLSRTVNPNTGLSAGTYTAGLNFSFQGDNETDTEFTFTFSVHKKAKIASVTASDTNETGATNEITVVFEDAVALDFDDIFISGAAVKSGLAFSSSSSDTYIIPVTTLTSALPGEPINVTIDLAALGADYAYQLANNDTAWTTSSTEVAVPRAIKSANVGAVLDGYSTAYIQFTLDNKIDTDVLEKNPGRVVITCTDSSTIKPDSVLRIDADMGYTFRALITPGPGQSGAATIHIDGIAESKVNISGKISTDGIVAGAGYYLDENGNNYLTTVADEFQQLPALTLGGGGQVYAAPDYTLRTDAEYDGWIVASVRIDGAVLDTGKYSVTSENDQPYIFDGVGKGLIAQQLRITLKDGWTEANGEHRIVTVLTGKAGNTGKSAVLSGKITITGLTPTYQLTVTNGSGSGKYPANRTVTITANEPPANQAFYRWALTDGGGALGNANAQTTSFVMPANAATVTAEYMTRLPTPEAGIDYKGETLTKLVPGASYTWTHTSAGTSSFTAQGETYAIREAWMTSSGDANFTLVRNAGDGKAASLPQSMSIPARGGSPGAEGEPTTFTGLETGKLIDVDGTMEYKAASGQSWTDVPSGKDEVVGLASGTYHVRYKARPADKEFASLIRDVEIEESTVAPTWEVSLSPSPVAVPSAAYGYSAITPVTVTIENTGNQPTGDLTVALSGTNAGSFTLTNEQIASIPRYGKVTFTIAPEQELNAGTYDDAAATVSGGNGILETVNVSFTVTAAEITGFIVTPASVLAGKANGEIYSGYEDATNVAGTLKSTITVKGVYAGGAVDIPVASWANTGTAYSTTTHGEYVFEATLGAITLNPNNYSISGSLSKPAVIVRVNDIQHGVTLDASSHAFPEAQYGYTPASKTINITNIGVEATENLVVAVSGDTQAFYVPGTVGSIAVGGSGELVVNTAANLFPGTYGVTITVGHNSSTNIDLVPKTYDLSFTVKAAEITSFEVLDEIDGGVAYYKPEYADVATVKSVLETSVSAATVNESAVPVTVTDWADTDTYNPDVAGSYTFTAMLETTIPSYYINPHNYTATVEVVVAEPTHARSPRIITNPRPINDGIVGAAHTLTVEASSSDGGTLSYQWYAGTQADYDAPAANSGTAVTDVLADPIGASYTAQSAAPGEYYYWCVITNTNPKATGKTEAWRKTAITPVTLRYAALTVDGGTISGGAYDGGVFGEFSAGDKVTVSADAAPAGQVFDKWTRTLGPDVALPDTATGEITMPAGDVELTATYKTPPYFPITDNPTNSNTTNKPDAETPSSTTTVTADNGKVQLD